MLSNKNLQYDTKRFWTNQNSAYMCCIEKPRRFNLCVSHLCEYNRSSFSWFVSFSLTVCNMFELRYVRTNLGQVSRVPDYNTVVRRYRINRHDDRIIRVNVQ
jgi:hypothetical protein